MGRRRNLRKELHKDPVRMQGLVWSCVVTDSCVFVCLRSRVDSSVTVRKLSFKSAEFMAVNPMAMRLLIAELEGGLCERVQSSGLYFRF